MVCSKNTDLGFCPYRALSVTRCFTQGVAIGLNLFRPFQGDFLKSLNRLEAIILLDFLDEIDEPLRRICQRDKKT